MSCASFGVLLIGPSSPIVSAVPPMLNHKVKRGAVAGV
jgi:hypothetical protein